MDNHSEEYKLWLNKQIAIGLEELDSGKGMSADGVRERIRTKAQQKETFQIISNT